MSKITPIKDGMSKEEAEATIKAFLSEVLSSDKLIKEEDISEDPTLSSYKVAVRGDLALDFRTH